MRGNKQVTSDPLGGQTAIVAAAAHELKNPLTLILYIAQMLGDDGLGLSDQERLAYIERLQLVSHRTLRLVQNLTLSYRLEQDRQLAFNFALEPVNVRDVCETALHELTPLARQYNQQLQMSVERFPHNAIANRDILYDVVVNLVDNAIRHSTLGAIVRVRPECSGDKLRVKVYDNGEPINKTDLLRLRRTLGQPQPLSGHSGTSGLGLYIASQLVESMGGSLGLGRAQSGTMFFIDVIRSRQLSLW